MVLLIWCLSIGSFLCKLFELWVGGVVVVWFGGCYLICVEIYVRVENYYKV